MRVSSCVGIQIGFRDDIHHKEEKLKEKKEKRIWGFPNVFESIFFTNIYQNIHANQNRSTSCKKIFWS
jgi:hypothetical protein